MLLLNTHFKRRKKKWMKKEILRRNRPKKNPIILFSSLRIIKNHQVNVKRNARNAKLCERHNSLKIDEGKY